MKLLFLEIICQPDFFEEGHPSMREALSPSSSVLAIDVIPIYFDLGQWPSAFANLPHSSFVPTVNISERLVGILAHHRQEIAQLNRS